MPEADSAQSESRCRQSDCLKAPARTIQIPLRFVRGKSLVGYYCEEHADAILRDKSVFPGAVEVDHAA